MTILLPPIEQSDRIPLAGAARFGSWTAAVLAVTLLALALRSMAINQHSFWYDEAVAAELIQSSYADLYRGIARDNGNPPLYWLLAKAWSTFFGASEVAMRTLPALCGILTVPLMAILGRRLLNPTAGLFAAVLLAISPLAIELSNEARTYALQELLVVASTLLLIRWLDHRRVMDWLLYAISMYLACLTHYYTFVLPLAHAVGLVVGGTSRRVLVAWFAAMSVAALLWLPWLPTFAQQLHTPGNLARGGQYWQRQFFATPIIFGLGRTFAWRDSSKALLALAMAISLAGFWVPALWALVQLRRRLLAGAMLAVLLLLPILGPLIVALTLAPLYHVRAASVALPAFLLLAAFGLSVTRLHLRNALLVVILAFTAISLYGYATRPLKDDWRSATPILLQNTRPDEPLVFDTAIEITSCSYYLRKAGPMPPEMIGLTSAPTESADLLGIRYLNGRRMDRDLQSYTEHITSAPGLWLILCVPAGTWPQYEKLFTQHGYVLDKSHHFHRIDLYHLTKPLAYPQPSPALRLAAARRAGLAIDHATALSIR
ncbi:MAG: glycosyltransferase family 39 protein [Bacillota bacterium]